MYHTIGQRQGLGIGGLAGHGDAPWYVAGKDLDSNPLLVVQGNDNPALFHRSLETAAPLWIAGVAPEFPLHCRAKVRYRQADQECVVSATDGGCRVDFHTRQRAVTPGQ